MINPEETDTIILWIEFSKISEPTVRNVHETFNSRNGLSRWADLPENSIRMITISPYVTLECFEFWQCPHISHAENFSSTYYIILAPANRAKHVVNHEINAYYTTHNMYSGERMKSLQNLEIKLKVLLRSSQKPERKLISWYNKGVNIGISLTFTVKLPFERILSSMTSLSLTSNQPSCKKGIKMEQSYIEVDFFLDYKNIKVRSISRANNKCMQWQIQWE